MKPPPHATSPRRIVEDALWDWWTTTDPTKPFDPADVAVRIDEYLHDSGLTIAPNLRENRVPTRRAIVGTALVALLCAASVIAAAARGEWGWAAIGSVPTALLTYEVLRDLGDRRRGRAAR
ncbi:hypothetical protein [Streptomyces sp.]|uniref:hypothetical protein n=1 Tax=Streptomyces sp. TaxID=1931 RepID=UPI0028121968|nr:hypothetical protein [Streptomyces sp.]